MYAADFSSLVLATDKHWMALSHSLPQSMTVRFFAARRLHLVGTAWARRLQRQHDHRQPPIIQKKALMWYELGNWAHAFWAWFVKRTRGPSVSHDARSFFSRMALSHPSYIVART